MQGISFIKGKPKTDPSSVALAKEEDVETQDLEVPEDISLFQFKTARDLPIRGSEPPNALSVADA